MNLKNISCAVVCLLLLLNHKLVAQSVSINTTGAPPHPSAMLDVSSTKQGFLPPRMTWPEIQAIASPAAGLVVYDIGLKALRYFDGTTWVVLAPKQETLGEAPGDFSAVPTGGTGFLAPRDMVMRPDKSVIVIGYFFGNGTIGSFSFNSVGGSDIFIAQLDSSGTVIWGESLGSTSTEDAVGVTLDASNNIYVCGSFQLTVDFDPGAGTQNLTATAGSDGFYAKYSPTGAFVWAKRVGGTGFDEVDDIATDGTNVFIGGRFQGTATFNPTSLTSFGSDDIFLGRYQASDGNIGAGWAIRIGSSSNESFSAIRLYSGNVLLCGTFQLTCDFGGTTRTSNGSGDGFYAVYNSFGGLLNVYQIGGTGNDGVAGITSDATGNVFVTGGFSTTVDFDPGGGIQNRTSAGGSDFFIAKYNSSGSYVTVIVCGGAGDEYASGKFLKIDNSSNLYFASSFNQTAIFFPYSLTPYASADIVLMKMNSTNTIEWAEQAGGVGSDILSGLAVSGDGKLIFTSTFYGTSPGLNFNKVKTNLRFDLMRYEE